jgi:small-conductance mechanosensitive channel
MQPHHRPWSRRPQIRRDTHSNDCDDTCKIIGMKESGKLAKIGANERFENPCKPEAAQVDESYLSIHGMDINRNLWKLLILLAVLAVAGLPCTTFAQQATDDASLVSSERIVATVPVIIDGRALFKVRGVSAFPAEDRARAIADRIKAIAADNRIPPNALHLVATENSSEIIAGQNAIMAIFDADANAEAPGLTRQALAQIYLLKIVSAIKQYREERAPKQLSLDALYAGGWTLALVVAVLALFWSFRRLIARIERNYQSAVAHIESASFRIISASSIWLAIRAAVRLVTFIATLAIFYIYLHVVLALFPWTRALAENLRALTVTPLSTLANEVLSTIPRLIILVVIIVVARYLIGLARHFFGAIQNGSIRFSGFEAEWANPTYNIVRVLIVAFAAVVCYPYIPGSQSAAFKGITIFIGVLFSLGSSSLLANLIAGYTMTYRRAFHVGDRIQIGDTMGDVTEAGLMVTHLRSIKNEEIVVPNSLILGNSVVNYSALARERGLILHTAVGIGYETPWRQVEAMLMVAAARTPGLLREPAPFVLQQTLGDYAVTYQINVYCDNAIGMYHLYTELHRNILDVFNEYNVQIMTPSYMGDPAEPKVVPRDQWFAKPAKSEVPIPTLVARDK